MNIEDIRIGYLGPPIDHRESLIHLFESAVPTLTILNDSITQGIYVDSSGKPTRNANATLSGRIKRFRYQLRGTSHPEYLSKLAAQIDAARINCIIGYWGTQILGDLIAVKKRRPNVVTLLNTLCHPTALTPTKIAIQNRLFRRAAKYLDGVIVSGRAMESYLRKHVFGSMPMSMLIWPPRFSQRLAPEQRLPPSEPTPNVLFLGRTDWHRAQPSDDVGDFLSELLDAGVHVFHAASKHDGPHPNRHTFEYKPLTQIAEFATQFDASLMLYNLASCRRTDRFKVTVPDRLIASVLAGIPIAMPSEGYDACREYLTDYNAVIQFDSPQHLAEQLKDRPRINALRRSAETSSALYAGELYLDPLYQFIIHLFNRSQAR